MNKLETTLGKIKLSNPVLGASGCVGHGFELEEYTDLSRYGALSMKTVTLEPRNGNRPPRICEVGGGMLSSIGLQNPGMDAYIQSYRDKIKTACRPDQIIISIGGNEVDDYVKCAAKIAENFSINEIAALEINAACPNVAHGGGAMGSSPEKIRSVLAAIRAAVDFPMIAKINTNEGNFCEVAKAAEQEGIDALYIANTPMGMSIDIHSKTPALGNVKGPVSGPAVLPQGVAKTWDLYKAVQIPIIGSGGIYTWEAAIQYILAGASAIGIGSAHFINPNAAVEILDGIKNYMEVNKVTELSELIGAAHRQVPA